MNAQTITLLVKAFERHNGLDITPCVNKTSFSECVTEFNGEAMLWYNTTSDDSTHIVKISIN